MKTVGSKIKEIEEKSSTFSDLFGLFEIPKTRKHVHYGGDVTRGLCRAFSTNTKRCKVQRNNRLLHQKLENSLLGGGKFEGEFERANNSHGQRACGARTRDGVDKRRAAAAASVDLPLEPRSLRCFCCLQKSPTGTRGTFVTARRPPARCRPPLPPSSHEDHSGRLLRRPQRYRSPELDPGMEGSNQCPNKGGDVAFDLVSYFYTRAESELLSYHRRNEVKSYSAVKFND